MTVALHDSAPPSRILSAFLLSTGLSDVRHEVRDRPDGALLIIKLAHPTERYFRILARVVEEQCGGTPDRPVATIKKVSPSDPLHTAEAKLLVRVLSETLTVNRFTFADDFFARYTDSLFGAEEQIIARANHVVFGRRGSGKSSLLLYAMHSLARLGAKSAWIDMQTYAHRADAGVIVDVLRDILDQLRDKSVSLPLFSGLEQRVSELGIERQASEADVRRLVPDLKRLFTAVGAEGGPGFTVFLDDVHVLDQAIQPNVVGMLYNAIRGTTAQLKLSAIESFTKLWDPSSRVGVETPHDAQVIKLDYNLTMPDKAIQHIQSILDSHALYCGLPSVRFLCTSQDVLGRLGWVAAGVPRDALNIFAQAITKAALRGSRRVTVTNVNLAASDLINGKLRDIQLDASGTFEAAADLLEGIKTLCIETWRRNAFLVEIKNDDPIYENVRKLIDLRLLHVVSEGISRGAAGDRYMALILDYGFYVGVRAAVSIARFEESDALREDLRALPVLTASAIGTVRATAI